jgi:hypothetical protein
MSFRSAGLPVAAEVVVGWLPFRWIGGRETRLGVFNEGSTEGEGLRSSVSAGVSDASRLAWRFDSTSMSSSSSSSSSSRMGGSRSLRSSS